MLVTPYNNDQPDNVARLKRLGVSRTIPRNQYNSSRVAKELLILLENKRYSASSAEVKQLVQAEDGVNVACDAIEKLLIS